MAINLYSMPFSPPCQTVLSVIRHLGLEVNLKTVNVHNQEHLNPEYVKLNPAHKVPTIVDNGFVLWESRAIAQYLCNKYAPDSDLYPKDPQRRAVVDRMLNFDIGTLFPSGREALILKFLRGIEPTEQQINALKDSVKLLDLFIGDNRYVAGNSLTIADLSILSIANTFEIFEFDLRDYPKVKEWLERLQTELPYFDDIHGKMIREVPSVIANLRAKAAQLSNQDHQHKEPN